MLGSVADAEDVVQEAFLRWLDTDRSAVRRTEAYLGRVVTRLCLDVLKSARHRREHYIGPWLPDPLVDTPGDDVDDLTLPVMLALERLSPLERAAFLLHDVFGLDFAEVGATIGRDPAACRQLASRARTHLRASRPRYVVSRDRGRQIAQAFFEASRQGDLTRLRALLADDVVAYADGGGRVPTTTAPVVGVAAVLALHADLAHRFEHHMSRLLRFDGINGLPGFVTIEADGVLQTTALEIVDGRVRVVYVTRNPDKLADIRRLVEASPPPDVRRPNGSRSAH